MSQQTTLRVLLNRDLQSADYEYVLLNQDGSLASNGMSDIGAMPIAEAVILVIPSNCLTMTKVKLPKGIKFQSAKFEQMLAPAIEDQILSDIAQVHIVAEKADEEGNHPIAIVDKEWLGAHIERFNRLERPVISIVAAVLFGLPSEKEWELTITAEDAVLRTDAYNVMWLDSVDKTPPVALILRLKQVEAAARPEKILIKTNRSLNKDDWQDALGMDIEFSPLPVLPAWVTEKTVPSLNFAIREFKPLSRKKGFEWRRLKWAAIILAVAVGVSVLDSVVLLIRDSYRVDRLQAGIQSTFKEAFPDMPVGNDPVAQMTEEVTKLKHRVGEQGREDFLPMLSIVGNILSQNYVHRVNSIDYQQGVLTIQTGPVATGVDTVIEQLRQQKYQVQPDISETGVILQVSAF